MKTEKEEKKKRKKRKKKKKKKKSMYNGADRLNLLSRYILHLTSQTEFGLQMRSW